VNNLNLKLSRPLSYDKNSSVASLRPPAALLHTAGRFGSESLADFSGIRNRLHKQRVLLDELFEQAPQAVALMSADNQIVRVNREFSRIFGYAPQEALKINESTRKIPILAVTSTDTSQEEARLAKSSGCDAERVSQQDRNAIRQGRAHLPWAAPITTPSRIEYDLRTSMCPRSWMM